MQENYYEYLKATGDLEFNMTNDYMFRMVLQRDEETLTNLICSVLNLPRESVTKAHIENPVEIGADVKSKEYQLDIHVLLNDNTYINMEMQVINYKNWPERSLSYLCRRFDNVLKGKDYSSVKPVYHIGFLDFTLFDDHPEFFGKYQMRNCIDNYPYTDKFNLYVVNLNRTDIATDEDKAYGIDTWAKLFKAKTWEDIKMITSENPSMNTTAESIYQSISDFEIRERCRAREDAIIHEQYMKDQLKKLTDENDKLTDENDKLTDENAHLRKLLKENGIVI